MTSPAATVALGPFLVYRVADRRRRRLVQLFGGLPLFGVALGLSVEAALGVNPWTVFHGGLALHTPLTIGAATILTGLALVATFPVYGEPIGVGTLANVMLVGLFTDLTIAIVPDLDALPVRVAALAIAPALIGLASGLYIGAGLGPGPQDGVMTALERRGLPIWVARTAIESTALTVGWLLGGDVGIGTVWMAASVGLWVQFFLRRLRIMAR